MNIDSPEYRTILDAAIKSVKSAFNYVTDLKQQATADYNDTSTTYDVNNVKSETSTTAAKYNNFAAMSLQKLNIALTAINTAKSALEDKL